MYSNQIKSDLQNSLEEIRAQGLFKDERLIESQQGAHIQVGHREVLNFCANNYLGLANNPDLIAAAQKSLEKWGLGLSSVRFICGTQDIHKELEKKVSKFLGTDETILYSSCFDANGGLFETILDDQCAIVSDELNHASIIDGIRLCKAERLRYKHMDMADLEAQLQKARGKKRVMIATDGVFSMDGHIAPLKEICDLADRYEALVMIDDCHATGFVGKTGRGTPEHCGALGRIDIINSTFGKALGGASGGFISGRKEIIELLRQRSRPYLFSNTLAPALVSAAIAALELIEKSTHLRDQLEKNTAYFREMMTGAGFDIRPGVHAIVPIMLGEAKLAQDMARELLSEGIYVIGFFYPVVPKGAARIRVQISSAHSRTDLDRAIAAFRKIGLKLKVIK